MGKAYPGNQSRSLKDRTYVFYNKAWSRLFKNLAKGRDLAPSGEKPMGNFYYVTIAHRKDFELIRYSLVSLLAAFESLPKKVIIASDGTWEPDELTEYIQFWPGELSVIHWKEVLPYHLEHQRTELIEYAEKIIWGRKLALMLKYAELGPTLFADTDVLWFKDISSEFDSSAEVQLKISLDNSYNYNMKLLQDLGRMDLLKKPPVNCGVVLLKGDLLAASPLMQSAVAHEAEEPGRFSEQTVLALASYEMGSFWGQDEVRNDLSDMFWPILSSYSNGAYQNCFAKHYVWTLKWQFWRDVYMYHLKRL